MIDNIIGHGNGLSLIGREGIPKEKRRAGRAYVFET
jgi:hypothetical protein